MDSRNKRSIVLDLKKPRRAALDRLIEKADVLICNFPPPVRDKLSLDLRRREEGQSEADLRLADRLRRDRPRPRPPGLRRHRLFRPLRACSTRSATKAARPACRARRRAIRATAMALVSSILMALIHRMKYGEGSWVGTSAAGQRPVVVRRDRPGALANAYLPHRPPPDRPRSALGNIYHTSEDRWLQLTIVREDKMWPPLPRRSGRPSW
jgi:formyl-CoA transferase